MSSKKLKIGVFDSGLGGLTVVRSMLDSLQGMDIYYVADTLNAPYGEKSKDQISEYSIAVAQYFISTYQIDALVVACNTATSAAIKSLREKYPNLILVGTEPGIKPALELTQSGKVGILATPATLKGDKYQELLESLGAKERVELFEQECPGLVEQIESDSIDSDVTMKMLEKWLSPMREQGVDTIVLGCTHYPLVSRAIRDIMQSKVSLVHTGEAITSRVKFLLSNDTVDKKKPNITILSTGKIDKTFVHRILKKSSDTITIKNIKLSTTRQDRMIY